jgi:hypothetical protein
MLKGHPTLRHISPRILIYVEIGLAIRVVEMHFRTRFTVHTNRDPGPESGPGLGHPQVKVIHVVFFSLGSGLTLILLYYSQA